MKSIACQKLLMCKTKKLPELLRSAAVLALLFPGVVNTAYAGGYHWSAPDSYAILSASPDQIPANNTSPIVLVGKIVDDARAA